uniref:Uncharacterized protein n=1 Tax=Oryzias latipes TaxID=8090 RepID=A0A3P9HYT1_ORYLA
TGREVSLPKMESAQEKLRLREECLVNEGVLHLRRKKKFIEQ